MSATTTHLRQFNHYNEFRTSAGIDGVLHYINSGHVAVPPGLTPEQTLSFTLRFAPNSGFVSRIVHGQQQLFYNQNTFDLEVVRPENKEARMLVIFNDPASGYGVGLQAFFKQCAMRYLNIKKPETDSFLHGQMNYNVAVKSKRQINKPLLTSYCSERYGCDLIDMSDFNLVLNASRRYIFVVGDYFSGMLWARGITNRMNTPANPTLSTALNDIILNDTLTVPAIIHCDNEFARGSFATYCLQHNIVLIPSSSYTPWSCGFIERKNREIRKKIAAGIARNNDLGWLAALPQYLNNINSQVVQKTNMTPRLLWRTGLHPPGHVAPAHVPISDHMTLVDRQAYKQRFLINRAHEWTSTTEAREFHLGDLCSISVLRLSSDLRRVRENGIGQNKISIWYSPVICSIAQIIPATHTRRVMYILMDNGGHIVRVNHHNPTPARFFSNELIGPIPPIPVPVHAGIHPQTVQRMNYLNRV